MIKSIEEADIKEGTKVLVRADWNVPLSDPDIDGNKKVLDTSKIEAAIQTINFALDKGARITILSHLGDDDDSLEPVVKEAEKFFPNKQVRFIKDPWNDSSPDGAKALEGITSGGLAVFENLRFWMEKENDDEFAQKLAEFGDIYVNEAFPVSHREHTSIVKLPKLLPSFAGFHFLEECEKLGEVFDPEHPFLLILGGAKFDTKLPLVEKFLDIADSIFIGGAMAQHAVNTPLAKNPKVFFPIGNVAALDANPETINKIAKKVEESKFILWNGPLGDYENGYDTGTKDLAKILIKASSEGKKVIVGGGDTENVIDDLKVEKIFYFISLGGGAMLDFLANGTLPGIEALNQ